MTLQRSKSAGMEGGERHGEGAGSQGHPSDWQVAEGLATLRADLLEAHDRLGSWRLVGRAFRLPRSTAHGIAYGTHTPKQLPDVPRVVILHRDRRGRFEKVGGCNESSK